MKAILITLALLLAACSTVAPDYKGPGVEPVAGNRPGALYDVQGAE